MCFPFCFCFLWLLESVRWFLTNSRLLLFVVPVFFLLFLLSVASRFHRMVPEELPASNFRGLSLCFSLCFYFLWSLDSVKWFLTNSRLLLFVVLVFCVLFVFSFVSRLRQAVPDELTTSTFRGLRACRYDSIFFGF